MMAVRTAVEQLGVIQLAAIRLVVQMMVDQPATVPVPAAIRTAVKHRIMAGHQMAGKTTPAAVPALRQILNGSGWRKR